MAFVFSPPAFVADLPESARASWSEKVKGWFREGKATLPAGHRLFSAADEDVSSAVKVIIPWEAFPRTIKLLYPTDLQSRWSSAEAVASKDLFGRTANYFIRLGTGFSSANLLFRNQDEYCEWHAYKDPGSGKLQRIAFTCENPEYWTHLAASDETKLVDLYRALVSPDVERDDLFFSQDIFSRAFDAAGGVVNQRGRYNPLNRWNTTDGVVHLTHPANSLAAEIFLAADATILRVDGDGAPVTDQAALICCAQFGGVNRSSDPTIGGRINGLVRSGLAVSIADPVGLYMGEIDSTPIEVPGGIPFDDCWKVKRGDASARMILHAEFALPEGSGFDLEDVTVGGEPLRFGGQLAELITVVIHGLGLAREDVAPTRSCDGACCRFADVADLQFGVVSGVACPVQNFHAPQDGSTLAVDEPGFVKMEDLPDPRRR
ncbi:MAG: hypothetical protein WAS21_08040 [Geminicoccaceae bacterium]